MAQPGSIKLTNDNNNDNNNGDNNEKDHYDQKCVKYTFKIGDKVLLYDESVRRGLSKKLESPWVEPYTIIELHNVNAKIKKGRSCQTVHLNRLKYFLTNKNKKIFLGGKEKHYFIFNIVS